MSENDRLLSDDEIYSLNNCDTDDRKHTFWEAGFLDGGKHIAKAQDAKTASIVAREILSQMELERCDPDVMAYFEDYYWIPKSVYQEFKQKWGAHVLRELIKKAFAKTKSQKEAGRLLGCYGSADEEPKKYRSFRHTLLKSLHHTDHWNSRCHN